MAQRGLIDWTKANRLIINIDVQTGAFSPTAGKADSRQQKWLSRHIYASKGCQKILRNQLADGLPTLPYTSLRLDV